MMTTTDRESAPGKFGDFARIGEMAREFGVTLRALRFYEDKGLLQPRRSGTTRLYSHREKARLQLILLGRKIGFPLRDIKEVLDLYDSDGPNVEQLRVVLKKSEGQMARLEKQQRSLEEAIRELSRLIEDIKARLGGFDLSRATQSAAAK